MKSKRIAAVISAAVLAASAVPTAGMQVSAAGSKYNYAEALQKSMFFYEVQQSGILPEWNSVSWRADSMVKEDGTPGDVVDGGWYDAGDHYKFTLTNAYSASIMAWGYLQYKDAIKNAGLEELFRKNIQWGIDYVLNCDLGDGTMIGTIGDEDDHVVWCSAEVYLRKHTLKFGNEERTYDTLSDSSTFALSAAVLAQGYMMFKDIDAEKAAEYLKHAKSLFKTADANRSLDNQGLQKNFYPATSWVDDCMYAANWLYMATGDKSYLELIKSDYIAEFPLENQSTDRKYTWGLCWDDTSQAAALLYAINSGETEWIDHVSHHLEYWMDGYGGKKVDYTPDGLAWLFNWGCLRHAANTAWIAEIASDTIFANNASLSDRYRTWAKGQMDYMFGDNALGLSYVLGMGEKNPTAIHHRTTSGIHDDHWNELGQESGSTGGEEWQTEYAHTLYGALIGGPDSKGQYGDYKVSDYQYTEVAIDYNAGYTAALCALIDQYGGKPLADFPQAETPKWAEWEVAAVLNGSGASYTEIKAWAMNHTAWPTRVQKDVEYHYFFDVTELLDAGLTVDQIKVEGKSQQYSAGEQGYATVFGPYLFKDNIYYANIKFEDGRAIMPTGQSEHRDEVQFRISIPDAIEGKPTTGAWDPANDWSYKGVEDATSLKSADSLNEHITMYVNGKLVWGEEPDGTKGNCSADIEVKDIGTTPVPGTSGTTTTTVDVDSDIFLGDTTCDKTVDVADAVLLARALAEDSEAEITSQGKLNADANRDNKLTSDDVVLILQHVAKLIVLK
ncbi:MAG: glycoside hydrolase family 9 protein [Oscillospiraceae bacterium]|nr:glycoside hydrolase family 9 protein [Oscillospiraceae bacterium]